MKKMKTSKRLHWIVTDFGGAEVVRKSDRPIWNGFRFWDSVEYPIPRWTDFRRFRRCINVTRSSTFDIFSDWLMDFASIAAAGMGSTDWQNFRRLVLVHVGKCPSKCWYCYNDAWENDPNKKCEFGEVSASEIIRYFKMQQERDAKRDGWTCNVLRLSGGEPFMQPDLVEDLAKEIASEKNIFFWVDTNLFPIIKKNGAIDSALTALERLKTRTAIHACFHGATDSKIKEATGTRFKVDQLLAAYKKLKEKNIPLYPRLNPCSCTPEEAEAFFLKLYEVDKRVEPAKLYLGPIELYYDPTRDRMCEVSKDRTRENPHLHAAPATIFWWDKMMHLAYGVGYGVVPRHLCDFLSNYSIPIPSLKQKLESERIKRPDHEFIFVSKGSARENYALKVLEALALPRGAHMTLELQDKYVEPTLLNFAEFFGHTFENKDVLIVATHHKARGIYHLTALRWAKLLKLRINPSAINLEVEISNYVNYEWNAPKNKNKGERKGEDSYDFLASYCGQRNLPINGYYCQIMGLPSKYTYLGAKTEGPNEIYEVGRKENVEESQAFLQAVERLNELNQENVNKNIYYRIARISHNRHNGSEGVKFSNGELQFTPGDSIEIEIDTFNKNLGAAGYPKEETAVLQVFSTEEERVKIVSQKMIRLSKFGRPVVRLKIASTYEQFRGEIVFQPVNIEFAAPKARIIELRLPFVVKIPEL